MGCIPRHVKSQGTRYLGGRWLGGGWQQGSFEPLKTAQYGPGRTAPQGVFFGDFFADVCLNPGYLFF